MTFYEPLYAAGDAVFLILSHRQAMALHVELPLNDLSTDASKMLDDSLKEIFADTLAQHMSRADAEKLEETTQRITPLELIYKYAIRGDPAEEQLLHRDMITRYGPAKYVAKYLAAEKTNRLPEFFEQVQNWYNDDWVRRLTWRWHDADRYFKYMDAVPVDDWPKAGAMWEKDHPVPETWNMVKQKRREVGPPKAKVFMQRLATV
jgi:hypothetical protein